MCSAELARRRAVGTLLEKAQMAEDATKISIRWPSASSALAELVNQKIVSGVHGKNGALATNVVGKGKDLDTFRFNQLAMGRFVRQPPLRRLLIVPESATRRRTAYGSSGCSGVIVQELAERMVDAAASAS